MRLHVRPLVLTMLVIVVLALAYVAGARTGVEARVGERGATLLVEWSPTASLLPLAAAVAAWLGLLFVLPRRWSRPWRVAVAAAVLIVGGGARLVGGFDPFGGWTLGDRTLASDGRVYRPAWAFWTAAVLREHSSTWEHETWEIVARATTDSPRRYALLVTPADRSPANLVESRDGVLVVAAGPRCYVAYDVEAGTALARESLDAVTPFALLRPEEVGADADLAEVERSLQRARDEGPEAVEVVPPADAVLVRELSGDNAWVRDAARRLARAGGRALYPQASTDD